MIQGVIYVITKFFQQENKRARGARFELAWSKTTGLAILRRTELGHPRLTGNRTGIKKVFYITMISDTLLCREQKKH